MTTQMTHNSFESTKAASNPSLLTLSGIYQTSKSVYVTYLPERATKTVEVFAEKLIAASTPYVSSLHSKVMKANLHENEDVQEPLSIQQVDEMISSLCDGADARVGALLSKHHVQERVEAVKERVGSMVGTRVESVKAVMHRENERFSDLKEKATDLYSTLTSKTSDYYSTVVDYTPAAKFLVVDAVGQLKLQVQEQGAVNSAKLGAHFLTQKAVEVLDTLRQQGPFAGAKTVVGAWSLGMLELLESAKAEIDPVLPEIPVDTSSFLVGEHEAVEDLQEEESKGEDHEEN